MNSSHYFKNKTILFIIQGGPGFIVENAGGDRTCLSL